jgi:hypothetical protein
MAHWKGHMCSLKSFSGLEHRSGFEEGDVKPQIGQYFRDRAAARARADHY